MNFFQRQTEARTLSRRLVWLFLLAVLLVVSAVSTVLVSVFAAFQTDSPQARGFLLPDQAWLIAHGGMVLFIMFGVLGVIVVASLYKTSVLSSGGGVVARAAGGVRVPTDTSDPQLRQLLNVVEEIAIASGIPVPSVYLLPHETGINAFAAGFNPSNAAIAVTQGCLDLLDRNELQGVVAHEFSHIVNGDMRLNIRLMGLLFGLTVIAGVARTVMRFMPRGNSNSRKSGNALLAVFAVAALVYALGYIGLLFGRVIQAAVARKRETLADASAVQFTRDPSGLRNALVKIGASNSGSRLVEADADAVAHMLFAPGMSRLFATHPPLEQRIKDIDPSFNPVEFAQVRAKLTARHSVTEPTAAAENSAALHLRKILAATTLNATNLPNQVGQPTEMHIELAHAIRVSLPATIVAAANNSNAAVALMFALALDRSDSVREIQLKFITQQLSANHARACQTWFGVLDELNPLQRQPALLRLLPTLRQLPPTQRSELLRCLNGLLQHSGRVSIEQYTLRKLAQVQLRDVENTLTQPARTTLAETRSEARLLLATLAQNGHEDEALSQAAYQRGLRCLESGNQGPYVVPQDWPLQLDKAFNRLDTLAPRAKQTLLEALVHVISHDGKVNAEEAELLRTTCACLHCPLPPLLNT
ncbi:MAG: M48 family metallopeptidase [Steroidobacteraceae bacterium]